MFIKEVCENYPELKHAKNKVIIIGYSFCPYSRKAIALAKEYFGSDYYFLQFHSHEESGEFRRKIGYFSTDREENNFPVIFIREGNKYDFVKGGATGFERLLQNFYFV